MKPEAGCVTLTRPAWLEVTFLSPLLPDLAELLLRRLAERSQMSLFSPGVGADSLLAPCEEAGHPA